MIVLPPSRGARRLFLPALLALCVLPAGAARADGPSDVQVSPARVSQVLFAAGDVRRLGRNPSGTVDTVLEKVLQQLYRDDPALAPEDAKRDIDDLRGALASAGAATSTATLAVEPGNQRVLAILATLQKGSPRTRVARAVTAVADVALTESSTTARAPGDVFSAAVDAQSTILYGSFSPGATLEATARLAASNARFGRARDALWAAASHESVGGDVAALLAENPALDNEGVRQLVRGVAPDGSLTMSIADIQDLVRRGMASIEAQGGVALQAHGNVERACPGDGCQASRDAARTDDALARGRIAAEQITLTAAAGLLSSIDVRYGDAIRAEAQAAAQIADGVNSYFAAMDYGEILHAASDAAGLVLSLAVAEVNPIAAVTGVVTVTADVLGVSTAGPDANALILNGLQGVSRQLSAFAAATSAQFQGLDARLERLTSDVGVLADRLSRELADVRSQVSRLGTALIALQGSVDRLHSEIKRLFAVDALNDLNRIVNQSLGHGGLSANELRAAAGALYSDATVTALSETLLTPHETFDADAVSGLGDLDPNVNFFAFFPNRVTDAPAGRERPKALADTCIGGDPDRALCLPDPDFWAASARAYAQILLENRDAVTSDRLVQLDAIRERGGSIDRALDRITSYDDGDVGTGNKVFNAVLDYYASWVGRDADRPASGPPTLEQALRAERARYIESKREKDVNSTTPNRPWIDPYGGDQQSLAGIDEFAFGQFTSISTASGNYRVQDLRGAPSVLPWLPIQLRNAVRLHVAGVKVFLSVRWTEPPAGPTYDGQYSAKLDFTLTGAGPDIHIGSITADGSGRNCAGDVSDSAERSIVQGWSGQSGCPYAPAGLEFSVTHGARFPENLDTSGFNRAIAAVTPLVDARLTELANGSLEDFVTQDGTLTRGNSRATDVQAAAERVGAATALFNGYVALGLPQALATDDKLHGVVAGEASDALLHPYFDSRSAVPAATVPRQVANYLKFVKGSAGDPIDALGIHFLHHRLFLEQTIRSYVVRGRALGQEPSDGGRLDESSPLVAATIDRLELTRAVLADHLGRPAPSGGTQPAGDPSPSPQSGSGPAAPGGTPAPAPRPAAASRARIVTAPRARAGAIRFTVRCLSGTCAVGASATAGGRTVGRAPALTLRAGAQRTVIVRLTSAGRRQLARHGRLRVTVRITLAGTTRPLAVTPLTLRR